MRLDDMRVFATVVECGGFTAAGRALGLPKSSISRRVQGLEEFLGVRLLQRTTRKLSLTDAGERYYADCSRILAAADHANQRISDSQTEPCGVLRLTAPPILGEAFLGPLINRYLERWPAVRVELDLSGEFRDLIGDQFDLAIRVGHLNDSSYVARRLGESIGTLCATPEYLARRGEPNHPNDLQDHDLIEFGGLNNTLGRWRFSGPHGEGDQTVSFEPRYRTGSIVLLLQAIYAGIGIGWLPNYTAQEQIAEGRLQRVLPHWPMPTLPVHAVYPTRENLAIKVRAFIELMLEPTHQLPSPLHQDAP